MFRRLLPTLFTVGLSIPLSLALLWAIEGTPAAVGQDNKNCPSGFNWIRMSGQCCVQDPGTLPANGKIGYTGNSLCVEGYSGVYEHRPTTDGKGPPGCPGDTSFPFLKECVKRDGAAAGAGALGGDGVIRDASEALYGGGGGPSKKDLAAAGGAIAATMVTAAAGSTLTRGPRLGRGAASSRIKELTDRLAQLDREYSDAAQELERAAEAREALWKKRKFMESAAQRVEWQLARLREQIARAERNLQLAAKAKAAWAICGICLGAAGVASALSAYAALTAAGAGATGAAATGTGSAAGAGAAGSAAVQAAWMKVRFALLRFWGSGLAKAAGTFSGRAGEWTQLKQALGEAKARTTFLQGRIRADLEHLENAYEQATRRVDDAGSRVRAIRSEQVRVHEQLQQARKAG